MVLPSVLSSLQIMGNRMKSPEVPSVTCVVFFFQAEDGIRDHCVTGVQTCALPILGRVARNDLPCHESVSRQCLAAGPDEIPPGRRGSASPGGDAAPYPCRRR